METDGTVKSHQKISDMDRGFTGVLHNEDHFGKSVANLGDLDGDGVTDLAVAANLDDDGGTNRGAVWVLFMNTDGTVKSVQKISDIVGSFTGTLDDFDIFGQSVTSLGDLDGDEVSDFAVGAFRDDDGGTNRGAVWVLFMNSDGTVKSEQKISDTVGGFSGIFDDNDWFGVSLASLGDLNGDGVSDLAVGAYRDDDGGTDRGAVWILFLNGGTVFAGGRPLSAELLGKNEVGGGDSDGAGSIHVTLNSGLEKVCYELSVEDIGEPTRAHIHRGVAGTDGSTEVPLFDEVLDPPADLQGCVGSSGDLIKEIRRSPSSFYVNIHNSVFPGGAIRGQLSKMTGR